MPKINTHFFDLFWKLKLSLKNISPLDWTQFLVTTHPHSWHPSAPLVDCKLPRPDVSMSWELKHSLKTPPQSLWQLYGMLRTACIHLVHLITFQFISLNQNHSAAEFVCSIPRILTLPNGFQILNKCTLQLSKMWLNLNDRGNLTSFLFIPSYCLNSIGSCLTSASKGLMPRQTWRSIKSYLNFCEKTMNWTSYLSANIREAWNTI